MDGAMRSAPSLYDLMSTSYAAVPQLGNVSGNGSSGFLIPYGAVVEATIHGQDRGEHPWHLHGHGACAASPLRCCLTLLQFCG